MPEQLQSTKSSATQTAEQPAGALSEMLGGVFGQKRLNENPEIVDAVDAMIKMITRGAASVSGDTIKAIQTIKAQIDQKLTQQLNQVMHHPDFQQLEGTWRGLHQLVSKSELNDQLKIRVMNISKKEIAKTLDKYSGARWDKSPLYMKIYQAEFGMPNGEPYGALIGDYNFSHQPEDVKVLRGMGQIATAAHAPFIAASSPDLLKLESWTELPNKSDISRLFTLPEYAAWRTLREHEDSRYIGLAFPRFMSRLPYGPKNPSDSFVFEEDDSRHDNYVWSNAAYAMGLNITNAFTKYGWTCAIRGVDSGGRVENLPVSTFETDDGGQDIKCPTEAGITMSMEQELALNGFMPLSHFKNTDYAAFIGAQSLNKPKSYNKADATANANLAARLPYIFATSRFAHFLKKMVYRAVGKNMEREDVERWLNNWIMDFVHPNPSLATEDERARKPLAEAQVLITEDPEDPGVYQAKFNLRPHFQLERIDISLSLVARVPNKS
jgi:type VI secretion system protein ImpC